VRQKANKARNAGVTIEQCSNKLGMFISHSLLAATRRRLALPPMPLYFFEALLENLCPQHLKIFLAYQKGKPIACHLVLIFRDLWISEYSGNADGVISGVNQYLYLETIRQACAQGAQNFSFGRTSIHGEGLLSYKRRWGATEENLTDYTLRGAHDCEKQAGYEMKSSESSRLYKLCNLAISKAPMPICKLIGNFCYRHLG
jgi:predicted N-acyltransferase